MTATKQKPRYTVEWQPDGWVVVDWVSGRAVSTPDPSREHADGRAAVLDRSETAR